MASARARSSYPSPPPEEVAARCYADLARHLEPAGAQEDEGADARMCAPTSSACNSRIRGMPEVGGDATYCAVSVVTASG